MHVNGKFRVTWPVSHAKERAYRMLNCYWSVFFQRNLSTNQRKFQCRLLNCYCRTFLLRHSHSRLAWNNTIWLQDMHFRNALEMNMLQESQMWFVIKKCLHIYMRSITLCDLLKRLVTADNSKEQAIAKYNDKTDTGKLTIMCQSRQLTYEIAT